MGSKDNAGNERPPNLYRFLATVLGLLAILHFYAGWRLLPYLNLSGGAWMAGIIFFCLSPLLIIAGMGARFLISSTSLADRISWTGFFLLGLFSSLLILTLFRDVLLIVLPAAWRGYSALSVLVLALLVTLVGYINAHRIPRVVNVAIPILGLPESLYGFTIAQISDLHIGPSVKRNFVAGVVDRANALHPDIIVITGDLVDGGLEHLRSHVAPLAGLQARHGVLAVTGNHEYYSGAVAWIAEFQRLGMRVLMNEHEVIEHNGAVLVAAGVTDYEEAGKFDSAHASNPAKAIAGSPTGVIPKILLAHQPRSAAEAEEAGFDLQLSGHTHGGQFWPWNLLVPLQQPFTAGLHRLGRLWIYTSRGAGHWGPPTRFGVPSEITLLHLEPAKQSEKSQSEG